MDCTRFGAITSTASGSITPGAVVTWDPRPRGPTGVQRRSERTRESAWAWARQRTRKTPPEGTRFGHSAHCSPVANWRAGNRPWPHCFKSPASGLKRAPRKTGPAQRRPLWRNSSPMTAAAMRSMKITPSRTGRGSRRGSTRTTRALSRRNPIAAASMTFRRACATTSESTSGGREEEAMNQWRAVGRVRRSVVPAGLVARRVMSP